MKTFIKILVILVICIIGAILNATLIQNTNVYSYILGYAVCAVVDLVLNIIDIKLF